MGQGHGPAQGSSPLSTGHMGPSGLPTPSPLRVCSGPTWRVPVAPCRVLSTEIAGLLLGVSEPGGVGLVTSARLRGHAPAPHASAGLCSRQTQSCVQPCGLGGLGLRCTQGPGLSQPGRLAFEPPCPRAAPLGLESLVRCWQSSANMSLSHVLLGPEPCGGQGPAMATWRAGPLLHSAGRPAGQGPADVAA